jgi:hypothetical protein
MNTPPPSGASGGVDVRIRSDELLEDVGGADGAGSLGWGLPEQLGPWQGAQGVEWVWDLPVSESWSCMPPEADAPGGIICT